MKSGGELVVLGRVSGVHGVRGWIKVFSHTRPMENILEYPHWTLRSRGGTARHDLVEGRRQGRGLVAKLGGIDDRDAALDRLVERTGSQVAGTIGRTAVVYRAHPEEPEIRLP